MVGLIREEYIKLRNEKNISIDFLWRFYNHQCKEKGIEPKTMNLFRTFVHFNKMFNPSFFVDFCDVHFEVVLIQKNNKTLKAI